MAKPCVLLVGVALLTSCYAFPLKAYIPASAREPHGIEARVYAICSTELLARADLDISRTRSKAVYFEGFWTMWGITGTSRWSCTVHQTGDLLEVEDVTVYPPPDERLTLKPDQ